MLIADYAELTVSGCLEASKPPAVVSESDHAPLIGDVVETAEVEADEADRAFDDAEDRFDGLFALFVSVLCILGLLFGFHLDTPWFCDAPRGLGVGRWTKVAGPVRLRAADGNQRFDLFGLQRRHRGSGCEAGVGQDHLRQADGLLHPQHGFGEAGRIGGRRHQIGGQDQLRSFSADDGLRVVGLAIFMRVGAAHQRAVRIGQVALPFG